MAYCLKRVEAQSLAEKKTKGDKDAEAQKLDPIVQKIIGNRHAELEKTHEASAGVCLIEVELEMELSKHDIDAALQLNNDINQVVKLFPALTKANCQRLLAELKANKAEFDAAVAGGNKAVVNMNFSGYGVHCGDGWIVSDIRLLATSTQIQNASITFIDAAGKVLTFEPSERLSFNVFFKKNASNSCSASHPELTFFKLGLQSSQDAEPESEQNISEWETVEQKLLDDAKLPVFRLPLFNDLDMTKKFSIVQVGAGADGQIDRTISLIDDQDIDSKMISKPATFFMSMKVKNLERYLPCQPRGGVAFSQDGDLFTLCGFLYPADDDLVVGDDVPQEEFLPLHGDTLTILANAKNFVYNRIGQALTEGQPIMYNYQMMAEYAKDLLIKSLGVLFEIEFTFPVYDEKFAPGHAMDVRGYFANEAAKGPA